MSASEERANVVSSNTMNKRKLSMTKHKVEVKISGYGTNAFLYIFDDRVLDLLIANSKSDDPLHCLDVLAENGIDGESICYGINATEEDPEVLLTVDGEETALDGLADIRYFDENDEEYEELIEGKILYGNENVSPLNGDIPEGMHAVVAIEYCRWADAIASFEADNPVTVQDLRINLTDLDVNSNYSDVTYHLGLLDGMELNLQSISYGGNEYEFSISGEEIKSEDVYLIERNSGGEFEVSDKSKEILLR